MMRCPGESIPGSTPENVISGESRIWRLAEDLGNLSMYSREAGEQKRTLEGHKDDLCDVPSSGNDPW